MSTGIVGVCSNGVNPNPALAARRNSWDDLIVKTLLAVIVVLSSLVLSSLAALGANCPKDVAKTEAALIHLENNWADALSRKDADTVACMLADEFEEADVDGSLHSRAENLAKIPTRKP